MPAFGDAVEYNGIVYYWEPFGRSLGFLYANENELGMWSRRLTMIEAKRVRKLEQDRRFRRVVRGSVTPLDFQHQKIEKRLLLRFLYGKQYLKALRIELKHYGIKKGLQKVYLAEMNIGRLTSKKTQVIRKLARKSAKHKCFLLISDRPTRPNYQADPALFFELAHYLGRHHHCELFSWDEGPSNQQLQALIGLIAFGPLDHNLAVPEL